MHGLQSNTLIGISVPTVNALRSTESSPIQLPGLEVQTLLSKEEHLIYENLDCIVARNKRWW